MPPPHDQVMLPITLEQRTRLSALRERGVVLRDVYRRALDAVLDLYDPRDDYQGLERMADGIVAGTAGPSTPERELRLAEGLRVAIAAARRDRAAADEAAGRWATLRARMRTWGEQLADELRKH
jgi:hypothetical protein